jgi:hypothetical protein
MSLNDLQLPRHLCVSLFKNNLVDLQPDIFMEKPVDDIKIDFLGGNERKIVFIANDTENKFLGDDQMKFVNDLLSACNLSMADIAFINLYNKSIKYTDVVSKFSSQKILIFGISTQELDLPFTIPFFQVQVFHGQTFLICPSLDEIRQEKDLKKQLWLSLKKIFNLQK